ncbi:Inosine/uridine-preferring nucleoside hydrolase domain-containing protein [Circinella umbellata]|nr:Inosine/uridine-preferring nucleoside hydrolase domain-containing protein [Circinella umbellata]
MTVEPIIIDTDPGVDDVLAIIFLLLSNEVHVKAITLIHGNTDLYNIKRNAVTLLHVMQKHRESVNSTISLQDLPVLAVGSELPLKSDSIYATYFHGSDGLGEIYKQGKYIAPPDWENQIMHQAAQEEALYDNDDSCQHKPFKTTGRDGADEILYQLKQAPPLTVSILAVGPLTNVALAYQRDPVTLSRVKRIVIMGGAVDCPGNVTSMAEFNFRADPDAADIVLSTSKGFQATPKGYRDRVSLVTEGKQAPIHVAILPLKAADNGDISVQDFEKYVKPLDTPLAVFCNSFLEHTFGVLAKLYNAHTLPVYDAYTGLLLLDMIPDKGDGSPTSDFDNNWKFQYIDLHVETSGQNTLGMSYYDKRPGIKKLLNGCPGSTPNNVQVITEGNGSRFRHLFLSRVFGVDINVDQQ